MKTIKLMRNGDSHMDLHINIDKLELIQKAMGIKLKAQVGILGSSPHNRSVFKPRMATVRNDKGVGRPSKALGANRTNAEIGLDHELGSVTRHLPKRSFLLMPLTFYLFDAVKKKSKVLNKLISVADIVKFYATLGIIAENVIQEAFKKGGPGWQPLSPVTIEKKGSDKILISTGQLRKSITSRVV